jgi:hypothetical protein
MQVFIYARMPDSLVIPARFNGPPGSGHGGYTCGSVAALVEGDAEVELRAPPPLDTPLDVVHSDGTVEVMNGDVLVARGRPVEIEVDVEQPVDIDTARAASDLESWSANHPFPTCFACGPLRQDGLREFPGRVNGREVFACTWTPEDSSPLFVWTALDCPTSAPVANAGWDPPVVLARLAVHQVRPPEAGRTHAVVSWKLGVDGRKRHGAAALFDEDGGLCAYSKALWIELRPTA